MSSPVLPAAEPEPAGASPEKFEKLLGRLEEIVAEMESAQLPLDRLLSTYEEGMRLVAACGERLADAEQKVEILSKAAATPTEKEAMPPTDTVTVDQPPEDIRLF
jgi:exodeoxyribonuclease VII small subunit